MERLKKTDRRTFIKVAFGSALIVLLGKYAYDDIQDINNSSQSIDVEDVIKNPSSYSRQTVSTKGFLGYEGCSFPDQNTNTPILIFHLSPNEEKKSYIQTYLQGPAMENRTCPQFVDDFSDITCTIYEDKGTNSYYCSILDLKPSK